MNHDFIKVIGIKDEAKKDAYLLHVNQVDGLKDILSRNFVDWSNFDSWETISVQQWIFSKALDVYKGNKITIKCDCCNYVGSLKSDFKKIKKEKCYGRKSAYMIKKVLDEIIVAKAYRETDGTYSA